MFACQINRWFAFGYCFESTFCSPFYCLKNEIVVFQRVKNASNIHIGSGIYRVKKQKQKKRYPRNTLKQSQIKVIIFKFGNFDLASVGSADQVFKLETIIWMVRITVLIESLFWLHPFTNSYLVWIGKFTQLLKKYQNILTLIIKCWNLTQHFTIECYLILCN